MSVFHSAAGAKFFDIFGGVYKGFTLILSAADIFFSILSGYPPGYPPDGGVAWGNFMLWEAIFGNSQILRCYPPVGGVARGALFGVSGGSRW